MLKPSVFIKNLLPLHIKKEWGLHHKNMKQFYFLATLLALAFFSHAQVQGASRFYGYKQEVLGGAVRVDENGNQISSKPRYNYFIYLASTTKVSPTEIWINGKAFAVNSAVLSTPVIYKNPTTDSKAKQLVPKTARRVLQITPLEQVSNSPNAKGKKLSAKNELVIIYKANGKFYYKALARLTMLEPVAMQ